MLGIGIKKSVFIILVFSAVLVLLFNRGLEMEDRHPAFAGGNHAAVDADTGEAGDAGSVYEKGDTGNNKGWHIHVNLDELVLYVFYNGEFQKSYPISGGAPWSPSPTGNWKIISKDTWGEGFGGAWLGFNVPWGQYGIHGTSEPWFIGRSNASKGCIRMANKDVNELFRLVPHGTTVTIVHDSREFRVLRDGDVGPDVVEIQKALKELGYYPWYIDGKYGALLGSSIKKFQKDNGLWGNGTVYRKTYDAVLQKAAELKEGSD